ncbi:YbaY family lipoprotein [Nocardia altamirensis]|uniref:YbaY family lipoprotein n=1 Tax=Nocardia altamirensis TaxID=472158 RepID=UPI00143553BF|nr:YbaY family lipoprotein [Nocardia altamirensis]
MLKNSRSFLLAVAALVLAGAVAFSLARPTAQADPVAPLVVAGDLSFEGGPPPDRAIITVRLDDVSMADAPSIELARQELSGKDLARFRLRVDRARIESHRTLAVSASVEVDGKLRWITDTRHTVPTEGPVPEQHLPLIAVP